MKKLKIYLDTSVPNAYLDSDKPERQRETKEFWNKLEQYDVYISDFVIKEIKKTPNQKRKEELLNLIKPFKILLGESDEIKGLAQKYIENKAILIVEDAIHVAIAVVQEVG
ncbi:MAG: PIN domain-containing protein, partial [bacterium]|nr:PIN domain-containing protein [bacterium]